MHRALLIVITGPPATGKTYLGKLLSKQYSLPYFSKDDFKEMMFDRAGEIDWETSRFFSTTSFETLKIISRELLTYQISHIIEANFKPQIHAPYLQAIKQEFNPDILQVQLQCQGEVLVDRFRQRAASGAMHPGHQGLRFFARLKETLKKGKTEPFEVDSEIVYIDTTNLEWVDYTSLYERIDEKLSKHQSS